MMLRIMGVGDTSPSTPPPSASISGLVSQVEDNQHTISEDEGSDDDINSNRSYSPARVKLAPSPNKLTKPMANQCKTSPARVKLVLEAGLADQRSSAVNEVVKNDPYFSEQSFGKGSGNSSASNYVPNILEDEDLMPNGLACASKLERSSTQIQSTDPAHVKMPSEMNLRRSTRQKDAKNMKEAKENSMTICSETNPATDVHPASKSIA